MHILCLKHVPFEGPASIAEWALQRGHTLSECPVYEGNSLPPLEEFDLLLVMGGPMNIYEEETYPWLNTEKAFIREAIDSGKYVIGICLGGQLIADILGAAVTKGKEVEIGWLPVQRAESCPNAFKFPEELRVFHWHGDTFGIPEGAVRLAGSPGCRNQGFLYGNRVLAWQCHLETTPASLASLTTHCGHEIRPGKYTMPVSMMQAEPASTYKRMQSVLFNLLDELSQRKSAL
ncbi:type 1 glutamine amidotransferase [Coraliomargarita parva]|uniref:type 1 glutamine amidotransferase n=1 Tax=Coraliomargarita parva TaxID=3014050 RepID=UPI0022B43297|nr:type 1 glutamine amidotransferase [Coraliomargarita parva]